VFGTPPTLATIGASVNVVGIIPTCENMPSGRATKPGDIVTSMAGKTIEVLNTDAEGRLILCDAITFSRRFKPKAVVDIATLTGACVIALGAHYCGLFSPDDGLAEALAAAGERADDRAWRLPVAEEYAELLKSNFADLANVAGREGGAITAACFLWKFAEGLSWAHLDIAGSAYLTGAHKGSTGRPVPLLTDWLLHGT
jgi:leucyl aminopeptidase